ncbi:claudin-34-like [Peromyscus californicus insignis]|uniref:claudin-34-like n=1 Tax=Peromyscus californicus insignis TaxID=564181 RepID=UPI0022A7D40B|nr:claudin-34-like [Peromyscus californicus insignis]
MMLLRKDTNLQITGFTAAILAWIFCSVSMGLPQWRVWYFQEPMNSKPSMALVGLWRTCIYHYNNYSSNVRVCHRYTYYDSFVPLSIRVAQHLVLVSSFFGMAGTVSSIVALWKLYTERVQKNSTYNSFFFPGILNILASSFVLFALLYNYLCITRNEDIAFPPFFHIPSFPDTQKAGSALAVATLAAFFFVLSGTIFISFTFHPPRHWSSF